jgi:hypothetical protein
MKVFLMFIFDFFFLKCYFFVPFIIHISKKNRQHNDQKEKYKRTNSDLQNIYIELTIEQHETHLKPGVGSGAQEG